MFERRNILKGITLGPLTLFMAGKASSTPVVKEDDWAIMPDICYAGSSENRTIANNCYTIHHVRMCRWHKKTGEMEFAHVNSKAYHEWLKGRTFKDGIPPHIQFGGAVVAGEGDPTFYQRWVEYVKETFVT